MQATAVQAWDLGYSGATRWYVRFLPSLTDFAFILPAFLLFVMLPGATTLLGDGDTGWHLRTGDWILQHRTVPMADFFSFTKPGQPWFAWEWGWDVLFATVHGAWGLAGVVFINTLLLCFISALLFRLIRRCSGDDILAFVFTIVAICGGMIHWLARPHLFSWLFIVIFAHVILTAEQGRRKALVWLPLLMLIWTNIHAAFFVGILMILASAAGEAVRTVAKGNSSWSAAYGASKPYLLCAAACISVTFANPYTWRLHEHIYRYLVDSSLLDNIQEFQSVSFHHGPIIFFECMLLLGAASVLWCVQTGRISAALLIALWAHLALVSGRNVPLFLLIAAPWTACMLGATLPRLKYVSPLGRRLVAAISEISGEFRPLERVGRLHFVSAAMVLVLASSFASVRSGFDAQFDPHKFPVQALPAIEAAKDARLFTYDQWSDYFIYRLYPSQRVFMDGRSDFYGAEFVSVYQHIIEGRYDWESNLKRYGVDMVLIKPNAPLATVLKQSPNWKMLMDDGRVILFRAASAAYGPKAALRESAKFSPILLNGGNQLEAFAGLQADNSSSKLKTQERRSL